MLGAPSHVYKFPRISSLCRRQVPLSLQATALSAFTLAAFAVPSRKLLTEPVTCYRHSPETIWNMNSRPMETQELL